MRNIKNRKHNAKQENMKTRKQGNTVRNKINRNNMKIGKHKAKQE